MSRQGCITAARNVDCAPRRPATGGRGRYQEATLGQFDRQDRRRVAVVVTTDGRRVHVPVEPAGLDRRIAPRPSSLASWGLMAFLASLPAPGGRTEERGGTSAASAQHHRRPTGPSPGGEGLLCIRPVEAITRGPDAMTMAKERHRRERRRAHRQARGAATCRTTGRPRPPRSSAPARACSTRRRDLKRTRIGADVLCEALLRQGVDVFFSYPGGVILPLYDVLGDYPELRHILVRHEQGGAHAADGYARVTGRVGVCMGTSGPGATNLVTGIGTALLDSVPMVAITGNVPGGAHRQGRLPGDRHQRHHAADDQAQLPRPRRRRPAARHRRGLPHRPDRPPRPGPRRHHQGRPPAGDARRASRPRTRSSPACRASARTSTATRASSSSRPPRSPRPSGRSSSPATASSTPRPGTTCVAFAEKTQIPVAWTLLGIGAIDETHPLAYGYMGMHGWKHVNRAIQSADLLIALGHALRRPRHRQRPHLRAVRPDHPRRHRPGRDRQERRGRGADRRRRRARPRARLTRLVERGRPGRRAPTYFDAAGRVETRLGGLELARLGRLARRAAVGRLRHRADRRADRPRRDLRRRRRPEPDVAGPLRRLPPAELPRQLGRPRARWASASRRRWAPPSAGPTGDLGDHRRRRLPDDLPGADDPRRGPTSRSRSRSSTTRSSG